MIDTVTIFMNMFNNVNGNLADGYECVDGDWVLNVDRSGGNYEHGVAILKYQDVETIKIMVRDHNRITDALKFGKFFYHGGFQGQSNQAVIAVVEKLWE